MPYIWGIVNAFDAQVRRLDRRVDKLIPELQDLERAQDSTETNARELELRTERTCPTARWSPSPAASTSRTATPYSGNGFSKQ